MLLTVKLVRRKGVGVVGNKVLNIVFFIVVVVSINFSNYFCFIALKSHLSLSTVITMNKKEMLVSNREFGNIDQKFIRLIHKGYSEGPHESNTNRRHHVSKYSCKAIISLHWHAMGGIIMQRVPEELADNIMLHRKTNYYHVMKGLV